MAIGSGNKVTGKDSEILTLKNKNEDMEVRMKRLERLIIKMSKEEK